MTDFVIRERDYDKVPHLLTTEVPGFLDSEELLQDSLDTLKGFAKLMHSRGVTPSSRSWP
jgi:hypothetical protein